MGIFPCLYCDEINAMLDESHVCDPEVLKAKIVKLEDSHANKHLEADMYAGAINRFVKNVQLFGYSEERMEELKKDVLPDTYKKDSQFCSPAHRNVVEDGAYLHVLIAALDFFRDNEVEKWHAYKDFRTVQDAIFQLYEKVLKAKEILKWNDVKVVSPASKDNLLYDDYKKFFFE